jgi:long-chain acyl-CoA synthetase
MESFLTDLAERCGDRRALLDDRVSRNFREVARRVESLSAHLVSFSERFRGSEGSSGTEDDGAAIAIFAHNSASYLELLCAATLCGLRYSPINWHWSADELAYVLDDAHPTMLFVDSWGAEVAQVALDRSGLNPVVIYLDEGPVPCDGWLSYEDLCLRGSSSGEQVWSERTFGTELPAGSPMFYTSGTTGRPKGVMALNSGGSTIGEFAQSASNTVDRLGLGSFGRVLLDGPIYHSAQWLFCFIPFVCGFDVVIRESFDPLETLRCIDRERITSLHLVPTQFVRLLRLDPSVRDTYDLSSLHRVYHGAAPCPASVKEEMLELVGDEVLWEYYGATESGIVSTISGSEWREHRGSVGKVTAPMVQILDEEGKPQSRGSSGLVVSQPSRAFRYRGDPVKTASVMMGAGLVFVGDIGYLDDDDYLYLSDRSIDMIISGGVNIYPAEIESVLYEDVRVLDAAVIGIPDEEFGESVCAFVVLAAGVDATPHLEDELLTFLRERLARYKVPRRLEFRPSLPRSLAGKLLKREIRAPYWTNHDSSLVAEEHRRDR